MAKKVSEKQKCKYCPRSYVDLDGHIERQHADKIQDEATGGGNNKSRRPNEKPKQSCPPRKNGNKKGSQEIGNSQNPSTDPIVDHWNVERRSLNLSESSTDSEDPDDQNNVSTDDRVLASRTSNVNDSMLEQFNDMRLNQPLDDKIESPETSSPLPGSNSSEIVNTFESTPNVSAISGSTTFLQEAVIGALNLSLKIHQEAVIGAHQMDKSESEISTGDRQIVLQNRDRSTKETNPQQRPRQSKKSSIGLSDALKALDDSSIFLNEEDDDENRTIVVCESSLGSADINDDNSISTDDPFLASNDIVNDSTSKVNYVNDALAQLNGLDISESFIDNNVPPESFSSFPSLKKTRQRKNGASQFHSDISVIGAEEIQSQTDLHKPTSSVPSKESLTSDLNHHSSGSSKQRRNIPVDHSNKLSQDANLHHTSDQRRYALPLKLRLPHIQPSSVPSKESYAPRTDLNQLSNNNTIPNHTSDHVNQHRSAIKPDMPLPQPSSVTEPSVSASHQYSNYSVGNIPRSFVPTKPSEPTSHHFSNIVSNPACKYSKKNQNTLPPKLQPPVSNSRPTSLHQLPPTKSSSSQPPSSLVYDSLRLLLENVVFLLWLNLFVLLFLANLFVFHIFYC